MTDAAPTHAPPANVAMVRINSAGGVPTIEKRPCPNPGPGEVLVRMKSAALNFADLLMAKGTYQETPPFPFTAGLEGAGEVVGVGAGVTRLSPGQRVVLNAQGALAEYNVFPENRCLALPDTLNWDQAAGFLVVYGTSHMALTRAAKLRAGQSLAVLGAAGGVGLTAVEIGAALGARVIAVARGGDRLETARQAGAAEVIDSTKTPDLRAALKALGGADVIYDAVGAETGAAAFGALRPGGHYLAIGFAAGKPPVLPLNHALVKNITIHGFYWGGLRKVDPAGFDHAMNELLALAATGRLSPHIGARYPLSDIADAYDALRDRATTGKIVITL